VWLRLLSLRVGVGVETTFRKGLVHELHRSWTREPGNMNELSQIELVCTIAICLLLCVFGEWGQYSR
jgi:hypothetical protein